MRFTLSVLCAALLVALVSGEGEQPPSDEAPATDKPSTPDKGAPFTPPTRPPGKVYFFESFSDIDSFNNNWIKSKATKSDDSAKYNGEWELGAPYFIGANKEDLGLSMPEANRLYAISTKLDKTFDFTSEDEFTAQFEVNFQDGLNCGGGYIKLLSDDSNPDLSQFQDKTPYSIMFGPDKCGQTSKIHFIIRFKNPITGEVEEKHAKQASASDLEFFNDRLTHLFTLFIRKDDYFSISVDEQVVVSGYLYSDLTPSIVPPKEINDPEDKKPEDWDDKEKIPEPDAVKPDDWDEDAPKMITDPDAVKPDGWLDDGPEQIPDPDASKPEDWDDEEDGEWEAPMIANPACDEVGCGEWVPPEIPNPAYKGKWRPPMIDNPNYMGVWEPRKINNPAYFELDGSVFSKLTSISALGFELWTVNKGMHFDNVIISSEITSATALAKETWLLKRENERKATGAVSAVTSWVDYFIEIANTYPYLWGLYAVILVLPFVLCAACCIRSKPSSRPSDDVGRRKKTDERTEDDDSKKTKRKPNESFVATAEDEEEEKEKTKDKEEASKDEEVPEDKKVPEEDETTTTTHKEQKEEEEEETSVRQRKGKNKQQSSQEEEREEETTQETEPTDEGDGFTVRKSPRRGGGKKSKQTKRED